MFELIAIRPPMRCKWTKKSPWKKFLKADKLNLNPNTIFQKNIHKQTDNKRSALLYSKIENESKFQFLSNIEHIAIHYLFIYLITLYSSQYFWKYSKRFIKFFIEKYIMRNISHSIIYENQTIHEKLKRYHE